MRRTSDDEHNEQIAIPAWVERILDGFRQEATSAGIEAARTDSTITWMEALVADVGHRPSDEALAHEWTTRADLRGTLTTVASQASRSACDALAVVVEFAARSAKPRLVALAADDLRTATTVLHHQCPAEADVINTWLARIASPDDFQLTHSAG